MTDAANDSRARILRGPLAWETFRFGFPLALGMALQTTFNLVDAWLVSHLGAEEVSAAVGAMGICDQLTAVGTIVAYGVSTATATRLSQAVGRPAETEELRKQNQDDAARTAGQSLLIIGVLSLLFAVVGWGGSGFLVRTIIGAKGAVADVAEATMRIMIGGSFSIFFLLHLTTMQRALGASKTPVSMLVLGNAINVALAVVFIFGDTESAPYLAWGRPIARLLHVPRLGMIGAAWATVLARSVVLLPTVLVLVARWKDLLQRKYLVPISKELRVLLSLAWPSSAQFVVRIAAMLVLHSIVARNFTTATDQTATVAMGLVFRPDTMVLFVAMGWGSAAQTFVGFHVGAGDFARAKRAAGMLAAWDVLTNVALAYAFIRYGGALLGVFCKEPAPIALGMRYLVTVAPAYLPLGLAIVLANGLAGAGETRLTFSLDLLVLLLAELPLCLLLGATPDGLFRGLALANGVLGAVYLVVFLRGRWLPSHGARPEVA